MVDTDSRVLGSRHEFRFHHVRNFLPITYCSKTTSLARIDHLRVTISLPKISPSDDLRRPPFAVSMAGLYAEAFSAVMLSCCLSSCRAVLRLLPILECTPSLSATLPAETNRDYCLDISGLTTKQIRHPPSRTIFAVSIQDSPRFHLSVRIVDNAAAQDPLHCLTICSFNNAAICGHPETTKELQRPLPAESLLNPFFLCFLQPCSS